MARSFCYWNSSNVFGSKQQTWKKGVIQNVLMMPWGIASFFLRSFCSTLTLKNRLSKRHHCKEFNAVLALCAPCEHSLARIFAVAKQHNITFTNRNLKLKWLQQEKGRGCKAFKLDSRKWLHWFLRNSWGEKWSEKQGFILHDWTSLTRLLRNTSLILSFGKVIQSCCNNTFWFWWILNKNKIVVGKHHSTCALCNPGF